MSYTDRDDLPFESHRGWAPCVHTDDGRERIEAGYLIPGATVEDLIFAINDLGPAPKCAVDQWWGISAECVLWRGGEPVRKFRTWIEGDSLLLALTETYKVWAAKYEEISGEKAEELHVSGSSV